MTDTNVANRRRAARLAAGLRRAAVVLAGGVLVLGAATVTGALRSAAHSQRGRAGVGASPLADQNNLAIPGLSASWEPGQISNQPGVVSSSLVAAAQNAGFVLVVPSMPIDGAAAPTEVFVTEQPDISPTARGVAIVYPDVEIDEEPAPDGFGAAALGAMVQQNATAGAITGTINGQPAALGTGMADDGGYSLPAGAEWVQGGVLYRIRGYVSLSTVESIASSLAPVAMTSTTSQRGLTKG